MTLIFCRDYLVIFARVVSAPFLLDGVVHLYDIFTAVYRLLSKRLANAFAEHKEDHNRGPLVSAQILEFHFSELAAKSRKSLFISFSL